MYDTIILRLSDVRCTLHRYCNFRAFYLQTLFPTFSLYVLLEKYICNPKKVFQNFHYPQKHCSSYPSCRNLFTEAHIFPRNKLKSLRKKKEEEEDQTYTCQTASGALHRFTNFCTFNSLLFFFYDLRIVSRVIPINYAFQRGSGYSPAISVSQEIEQKLPGICRTKQTYEERVHDTQFVFTRAHFRRKFPNQFVDGEIRQKSGRSTNWSPCRFYVGSLRCIQERSSGWCTGFCLIASKLEIVSVNKLIATCYVVGNQRRVREMFKPGPNNVASFLRCLILVKNLKIL